MRSDANVEAKDGAMSNDNCSCHAQVVGLSHTDSGLERRRRSKREVLVPRSSTAGGGIQKRLAVSRLVCYRPCIIGRMKLNNVCI